MAIFVRSSLSVAYNILVLGHIITEPACGSSAATLECYAAGTEHGTARPSQYTNK